MNNNFKQIALIKHLTSKFEFWDLFLLTSIITLLILVINIISETASLPQLTYIPLIYVFYSFILLFLALILISETLYNKLQKHHFFNYCWATVIIPCTLVIFNILTFAGSDTVGLIIIILMYNSILAITITLIRYFVTKFILYYFEKKNYGNRNYLIALFLLSLLTLVLDIAAWYIHISTQEFDISYITFIYPGLLLASLIFIINFLIRMSFDNKNYLISKYIILILISFISKYVSFYMYSEILGIYHITWLYYNIFHAIIIGIISLLFFMSLYSSFFAKLNNYFSKILGFAILLYSSYNIFYTILKFSENMVKL